MTRLPLVIILTIQVSGYSIEHPTARDHKDQKGFELNDILNAWRAREDRIRTIHLEWEGDTTFGKGSLFWPFEKYSDNPERVPPVPAQDTTYDTRGSLHVDTSRNFIRLRENVPSWYLDKAVHYQQEKTYVLRNGLTMSYRGITKQLPAVSHRGYISRRESKDIPNYAEMPLIWAALFPSEDRFGYCNIHNGWRLSREPAFVDGSPCVVLERNSSTFQMAKHRSYRNESLLVDPAKDFAIVRYFKMVSESLRLQDEFTYRRHDQLGWFPTGWKSTSIRKDNRVLQEFSHRVTRCDVNVDLDDTVFELRFPKDTWVVDRRTSEQWIVGSAGKNRPITHGELARGATHRELITTHMGQSRGSRGLYVMEYLVIGILGVAAVVLVGKGYLIRRSQGQV